MEDQELTPVEAFEEGIRDALEQLDDELTFAEAIGVLHIVAADLAAQAIAAGEDDDEVQVNVVYPPTSGAADE